MQTASPLAPDTRNRTFRIAVVVVSVAAAIAGSVLLATRDSGKKTTTVGVSSTLRLSGHPGSVVAGADALWVSFADANSPVRDRPLVRIELATGSPARPPVHLGGQASHLAHIGEKLIASVQRVGSDGSGPTWLTAIDWRSGIVLERRSFDEPVEGVVSSGNELWVLESGTLLRLDPTTLVSVSAPAPLALPSGRTFGLASGAGYLWVTASDAGEVLRIDPATRAIRRVHVGGFPMGIVVTGGTVWFADRERGNVVRLDPRTLRTFGDPVAVGAKPTSLAAAAGSLFVAHQDDGTVALIDVQSGKQVGSPVRVAPPSKGAAAPAMTSAGQSVWVSSFASNTLTRINAAAAASAASPSTRSAGGGKVTVRITGTNDQGDATTDGDVAGTGRFTASGTINDTGVCIAYRRVNEPLITLRFVAVGKKGTITFVVNILLNLGTSRWTITSGTKAYKGLHGQGIERENDDYTISTLTGTIWR